MIKKRFECIAVLTLHFKDGRQLRVLGGQGVVAGADIEFDEEGVNDTTVAINHVEFERGLVSRIDGTFPPLVSYDFKNVFARPELSSDDRDMSTWKLKGTGEKQA